jgi:hypothetical protein
MNVSLRFLTLDEVGRKLSAEMGKAMYRMYLGTRFSI